MGWERRGNQTYFYRKRRIGKRVVSQYIGKGEWVNSLVWLDGLDRQEREEQRWRERQEQNADAAMDRAIAELSALVTQLTHASLLAAGYHTHRGQWRRKRNGREQGTHGARGTGTVQGAYAQDK